MFWRSITTWQVINSAHHERNLLKGLQQCYIAYTAWYLRLYPEKLLISWYYWWESLFSANSWEAPPNQINEKTTQEDITKLEESLKTAKAVETFITDGELSDEFISSIVDVKPTTMGKPRSDRCMSGRRGGLLSNPKVLEKWRNIAPPKRTYKKRKTKLKCQLMQFRVLMVLLISQLQ